MVERLAVNEDVPGSSPGRGASKIKNTLSGYFLFYPPSSAGSNRVAATSDNERNKRFKSLFTLTFSASNDKIMREIKNYWS